jgi:Flp pilus assembly protein TadB
VSYIVRDQGREIGSFSLDQIEAMLDDHEIGMMAEVYDGNQWITVADLIENTEEERRRETEQLILEQKAAAKRQAEEQRRRETELEIEKQRTRQMEVELEQEPPLHKKQSGLGWAPGPGSNQKLTGTGIAGYVCIVFSFFLACIFWLSIIFGFPLMIGISFWVGVATGAVGLILGITNSVLSRDTRMHGVFQILGSVICLLLLIVPFIFLEVLIAKFT